MRTRMVTRTIKKTIGNVVCFDKNTGNTFITQVTVNHPIDDKGLVKIAQKVVDNGVVAGFVQSREVVEKLYGMSKEKFIELAEEMPNRV